ncbi:MAG: bifunctional hydroxymethylpyrimidine kinase/phosphomethylpyrimidine kinase [bacterium]
MLFNQLPVMVTIAGSDSGGGAGIQADLKTFAALGTYGTSAITAITAQNPEGVTKIQPVEPDVVAAQVRAIGDYFAVGAAKTGMLFSAEIIEAVADAVSSLKPLPDNVQGLERPPLVVDPVMVASSGAKLLSEDAMVALTESFIPLATLVTPNMDEAAILAGMEVTETEHLESAAKAIHERCGVPVLVKGGHLEGDEVLDVLYDGKEVTRFRDNFLLGVNTHGSGCTLSAAIAVYLMRGLPLPDAVSEARLFLRKAMGNALPVGRSVAINHQFAPHPIEMF